MEPFLYAEPTISVRDITVKLWKKSSFFFNAEPAVVVTVMKGITTIMREFPNGEKAHLPVMSAGFPSRQETIK